MYADPAASNKRLERTAESAAAQPQAVMRFSDFYGRNTDAWIDCLTHLDDPDAGMSRVHAPAGGVVTLKLLGITEFAERCPVQYKALTECAAFVNWRLVESGHDPVLSLAFYK